MKRRDGESEGGMTRKDKAKGRDGKGEGGMRGRGKGKITMRGRHASKTSEMKPPQLISSS